MKCRSSGRVCYYPPPRKEILYKPKDVERQTEPDMVLEDRSRAERGRMSQMISHLQDSTLNSRLVYSPPGKRFPPPVPSSTYGRQPGSAYPSFPRIELSADGGP